MAIELDITLTQGKTFELALMYASDERVYVPIAGVLSLAPVRLMLPVRKWLRWKPAWPNWKTPSRRDLTDQEL